MEKQRIVYKGTPYRRYPQSKSYSDRAYYRASPGSKFGTRYLHQEIWKDAHGEIPKGYHVHHRDGDPSNNSIDNLELKKAFQHRPQQVLNRPRDIHNLANIQPLSV